MRGSTTQQISMLSTLTPEQLGPLDHPLRRIKVIVDRALAELSPVFDAMYAANGRASIPPEHLLKGCLLIALYSIRSERQFCEQLQYNLLFKWFLDMDVETPAFDATSFTKNRDRLLSHEVAPRFFQAVLAQAKAARLISAEHFTVDGTLLEAWASLKSFQPRDPSDHRPRGSGGGRNPEVDFRGSPRRNETHVSTTDPEARLFTKGPHQTAKLCYSGNVLMENRHAPWPPRSPRRPARRRPGPAGRGGRKRGRNARAGRSGRRRSPGRSGRRWSDGPPRSGPGWGAGASVRAWSAYLSATRSASLSGYRSGDPCPGTSARARARLGAAAGCALAASRGRTTPPERRRSAARPRLPNRSRPGSRPGRAVIACGTALGATSHEAGSPEPVAADSSHLWKATRGTTMRRLIRMAGSSPRRAAA